MINWMSHIQLPFLPATLQLIFTKTAVILNITFISESFVFVEFKS